MFWLRATMLVLLALFISGGASDRRQADTCEGYLSVGTASASAPRVSASTTAQEKAAQKFAADNGIQVATKGDRFVFTLTADGVVKLFTTAASDDGLKDAANQLVKLVDAKIKKVSETFDVDFSDDDEFVEKQWVKNDKDEWVRGVDVKARKPRLNELYGIEAALYRAQPSHMNKDGGRGIKFYFLLDDLTKGERPLASYRSDRNGRPAIHYYPGACDGRAVIERDAAFNPNQPLGHSYASIEALTLHEMGHNHQRIVDWWNTLEKDEAPKLGYRDCGNDKDGNRIWALESSKKDSAGEAMLYRLNSKTGKWYHCDNSGTAVKGEAELSKAEMRKIAAHKPMTYYFPSPGELFPEGLMAYRLGGDYRASLLNENPALYDVVKRLDQKEIDWAYGQSIEYEWRSYVDQWGNQNWYQAEVGRTAKYLRGVDGKLVKNSSAAAAAVRKFEKDARKRTTSSVTSLFDRGTEPHLHKCSECLHEGRAALKLKD